MELSNVSQAFDSALEQIGKVIVGQIELVEGVLIALLSEGSVLIEGPPGLGKTLLVNVLSRTVSCDFNRVQFTPDLMPSDLTGHSIYDMKEQQFRFNKGPVFTNILLADEINRSPPKTQASLLEVMQEQQVTVDGTTHTLDRPFLVIATQNPIEHEGTYPLPEAQVGPIHVLNWLSTTRPCRKKLTSSGTTRAAETLDTWRTLGWKRCLRLSR